MAGTKSSTIISMKILVEKNQVAPIAVGLKFVSTAINRSPIVGGGLGWILRGIGSGFFKKDTD
jgi:hypothetical protein